MRYVLSQEADQDLENIFDYTDNEFGSTQAVKYLSSFDALFEKLCQNPLMGRERNEIRPELRSFIKDHHIVFYRLLEDRIRIVRILHGSRDLPRHFLDE